jgi:hemerythrin-like domain-containing protein
MTSATDTLRREHDVILRMLDAAEEVARQFDAGAPVEPRTLERLHEFFRLFADQCHHGKEEDLLFPKLEEKGIPRQAGPIGVMLIEHDQGREWIRQMIEAAAAHAQGRPEGRANWARAARGYTTLLRQHIAKENDILFVMAERMLSPEEQRELSAQFERVEEEKSGAGTHQRLHALMDELLTEIWKEKAVSR